MPMDVTPTPEADRKPPYKNSGHTQNAFEVLNMLRR